MDLESGVNLAVLKPVKMSTQQRDYEPSRAVDGRRDSIFNLKSCSATKYDTKKNWWQVDLQGVYIITHVIITNPADEHRELLLH